MKVLIHGAINMSNYGDFLFAELFSNALKENGMEVEFYSHPKYGISDYFAKYLCYTPDRKHYKLKARSCDALVYISGGYFLSHKNPLIELRHTIRYLTPAKYFLKNGKAIYVLGVGVGPFYKGPFRQIAKKVLVTASAVTVRNDESKEYCLKLGINRDIPITADTALLLKEYMDKRKTDIPSFEIESGKKMLLFHIDNNPDVKEKLKSDAVPALKKFLDRHEDYVLYLATDGQYREQLYAEYVECFTSYSPCVLKYDDPWLLTRQIERADLILTTKLHMGIVGSTFGCSVVSFPWHKKTLRFYKQIGETARCILLSQVNEEIILSQLERYEGKSISLPNELKDKARLNIELLPKLIP